MDVNQMQKLPGMPSGFPFAMILLGIVALALPCFIGSFDTGFFQWLTRGLNVLGAELVTWGAVLQGVHWICTAFARKPAGPAA
jgi:hypothetical protein